MNSLRALLDTNVIVWREAARRPRADIGLLFNWLDRLHITKHVHPATMQELSRYHDTEVVRAVHVRATSYIELRTVAPLSPHLRGQYQEAADENSRTDILLLNELAVRFRLTAGSLGSLRLLLPAGLLARPEISDLSGMVLNEKINDLIFGVVAKTRDHTVSYVLNGDEVTDTVVRASRATIGGHGEISIIFDRKLAEAESDSKTYYVWVRFECRNNSSMMFQKGWGYAKQGLVFRCLMNDVRASAELRENSGLADQLLNIGSAYVFLIAPSEYIPALTSPQLHYSRLLEAGVWKEYLHGCGALRDAHTYTIHQWRRVESITSRTPFRSYMHLHREFGWGVRVTYFAGLLTVPVLGAVQIVLKHLALWPAWWP